MIISAILGAGPGGQSLAALLKKNGHEVRLWDRFSTALEPLQEEKTVHLRGAVDCDAPLDLISNDLNDTLAGATLVFVVVPAHAHADIATLLAPLTTPNQLFILCPGRTAGALDFQRRLRLDGCDSLPMIAETQSLWCACRSRQPGLVEVLSVKRANTIAFLPPDGSNSARGELVRILRSVEFAPSILHTGLENIGAMLHPMPVLLNAGWIETRNTPFPHYHSITGTIAHFLEELDRERITVARAFGVRVRTVSEWHEDVYECRGDNILETLRLNSGYASIDAPSTLRHRYIYEDVPTGLVPISELGRVAGVGTPYIDLTIDLASALLGEDFRKNGRNLSRLGLLGLKVPEVVQAFEGRLSTALNH